MIRVPELNKTICIGNEFDSSQVGHFLEEDVDRVLSNLSSRAIRYSITDDDIRENRGKADQLRSKGWIKLEGALSDKLDVIDSISKKTNTLLSGGELDLKSEQGKQSGETGTANQQEDRLNKLFLSVPEPLYNVPEIAEIIFHESLVGIAKSFFESMPAIGNINLRKSFVNDLPNSNTTMFHADPNSPFFIKAFVYLKDVDSVEDGPFTYVEGSVDEKPDNFLTKYRWPDEDIESFYGKQRIKHLTAKKGDALFAMTTGFHKGQKCVRKDRELLTIDYICHPDSWDMKDQLFIKKETFLSLPSNKTPLTDFLNIRE